MGCCDTKFIRGRGLLLLPNATTLKYYSKLVSMIDTACSLPSTPRSLVTNTQYCSCLLGRRKLLCMKVERWMAKERDGRFCGVALHVMAEVGVCSNISYPDLTGSCHPDCPLERYLRAISSLFWGSCTLRFHSFRPLPGMGGLLNTGPCRQHWLIQTCSD